MSQNRGITAGVQITGDAKGFKSAADDAAKASQKLRDKLKAHNADNKKGAGEVNGAVKEIAGSFGELPTAIASIATAMGPLAVIVAAVEALSYAWKQAKEDMKLYDDYADRQKVGAIAYQPEAKAARKETAKVGIGGMLSSLSEIHTLNRELKNGLITQQEYADQVYDLNHQYKESYELLQKSGTTIGGIVTSQKDRAAFEKQYRVYAKEIADIEDEIAEKQITISENEAEMAGDKAKIADADATEIEKQKALADFHKRSSENVAIKTGLLDKQIDLYTRIGTATGEQERYEAQIYKYESDKKEAIRSANVELVQTEKLLNRIDKAALKNLNTYDAIKSYTEQIHLYTKKTSEKTNESAGFQTYESTSNKGVKSSVVVNPYALAIVSVMSDAITTYSTMLEDAQKRSEALQTVTDSMAGTFQTLGNAIGGATGSWLSYVAGIIQMVPKVVAGIALMATAEDNKAKKSGYAMILGAGSAVADIPIVGPILAIAAIAAMIAAIASVPKMAEGSVVNGATYAMIGESGPEAVLNKMQLGNMVSSLSGGGPYKLVGKLKGKDILISAQRAGTDQENNT